MQKRFTVILVVPLKTHMALFNKKIWSALSKTKCLSFTSVHCNLPMGVSSRKVPDQLMTASSSHGGTCLPKYGRLATAGYAWCSRYRNNKQWLQVIPNVPCRQHYTIGKIV